MLLIQYSFIKKYSDGMSYASTEYRNLNDFYYLIGIGMPFMTSVSLTPWEIAVKIDREYDFINQKGVF
jgi:hypothetical protein